MSAIKDLPLLRILSQDKLVKSDWLNKAGVQKLRIKAADTIFSLRSKHVDQEVKEDIDQYFREGILRYDQFLSTADFEALVFDCNQIIASEEPTSIREEGPNKHRIYNLRKVGFDKYPEVKKYLGHPRIAKLFSAAERKSIDILRDAICQLQVLDQGELKDKIDPETDLHADTFFNTNKAWIYLTDVTPDNAPFVFVNRSHKFNNTPGRMEREYEYSLNYKVTRGSRRISPEEVSSYGLEESVYSCPKNTYVMANTLGFHKRLKGAPGQRRVALSISTRYNPFTL